MLILANPKFIVCTNNDILIQMPQNELLCNNYPMRFMKFDTVAGDTDIIFAILYLIFFRIQWFFGLFDA